MKTLNLQELCKSVLEPNGIQYKIKENEVLIEFWTDYAGQDILVEFDFDGTVEDFVKQFAERAENYNIDDEVEIFAPMRGQRGVPSRIMDIIRDCQEAKDTLMQIADKLKEAIV